VLAPRVTRGAWAVLHRVTVAANDTTLAQSDVEDVRTWAYGAGGMVHMKGAAATPSLAASLPPWTPVFDEDAPNHFFVRDATTGLLDVDGRPKVAALTLSRTAAPDAGADSGFSGMKQEFVADSSNQVGTAPAWSTFTGSSLTQLVIGESGLYQLDGYTDTRGTNNSVPTADGFIEIVYSTNNGSTWTTIPGGVFQFKAFQYIQHFSTIKLKLLAGWQIVVALQRTVGRTENINGRMSLTQIRTLV
jgi:hypothetical protein